MGGGNAYRRHGGKGLPPECIHVVGASGWIQPSGMLVVRLRWPPRPKAV